MSSVTGASQSRCKSIHDVLGMKLVLPLLDLQRLCERDRDVSQIFSMAVSDVFHCKISGSLRCRKDDNLVSTVMRMFACHLYPGIVDEMRTWFEGSPSWGGYGFEENIFDSSRKRLMSMLISDFVSIFGLSIEVEEVLSLHYKRGISLLRRLSSMTSRIGLFALTPILNCLALIVATRVSSQASSGRVCGDVCGISKCILTEWLHLLGAGIVSIDGMGNSTVKDWVAQVIGGFHLFRSGLVYIELKDMETVGLQKIVPDYRHFYSLTFQDVEYNDFSRIIGILDAMWSNSKRLRENNNINEFNGDCFVSVHGQAVENELDSEICAVTEERGQVTALSSMRCLFYRFSLLLKHCTILDRSLRGASYDAHLMERSNFHRNDTEVVSDIADNIPSTVVRSGLEILLQVSLVLFLKSRYISEVYGEEIASDLMERINGAT